MLPGVIEDVLEDAFAKSLCDPVKIEVEVKAFPAAKIMLGLIDTVIIHAEGLRYDKLYIKKTELYFENFTFEPLEVLRGNEQFTLNQTGDALFIITEESINDYVKLMEIPGVEDLSIQLLKDGVILNSMVKFMGTEIPVTVTGYFQVEQGIIFFKTREINLGQFDFGNIFEERLKEKLTFTFKNNFLPVKMEVSDVSEEDKHLILKARVFSE